MPPKTALLPGLTPLRGIAALLVIFFHYNFFITELISAKTNPSVGKLYLMVDLFFVLSGFVMSHVYGDYFKDKVDQKGFLAFAGARFARIYPLHLATFGLVLILGWIATHYGWLGGFTSVVFDFNAVIPQLLMLQGMGTQHEATWLTPTWSISVEWWVYGLFPFLVLWLARTGLWSRLLILALILIGYASILYYFQPHFWAERWAQFNIPASVPYPLQILDVITGPGAFIRCLCGFAYGLLLYELYRTAWAKAILGSGLVFVSAVLGLFLLWQYASLSDVAAIAVIGLIIISAAHNTDWLGKALNSLPLRYAGDISYSLYLVHMLPILSFMVARRALYNPDPLAIPNSEGYIFPAPVGWAGLAALYALSIAMASLTYYFVEKPARKVLRDALAKR